MKLYEFIKLLTNENNDLVIIFKDGIKYQFETYKFIPYGLLCSVVEQWNTDYIDNELLIKFWLGVDEQ